MGSMYETLRQLPLFAGVSQQKLSEIVGHNKFHFLKYAPGDMIVEQGAECTHIRSVIAGSVRMSIESHDNKFKASQTLNAPDLIAPDFFSDAPPATPARLRPLTMSGYCRSTSRIS